MLSTASQLSSFGPFADRFEKVESLYLDPGFENLLVKDLESQDQIRLQLLHQPEIEKDESLSPQWEAIKACQDKLWFRPQDMLREKNWVAVLSWVPPGKYFNEISGTLQDEFYLRWMREALKDLASIHEQGLVHLAQNEKSWILFKADEERGDEVMGLIDIGVFTEVPFGHPVTAVGVAVTPPELLRGQKVDARGDLYSLAALILRQRSAHQFLRYDTLRKTLELHLENRMIDLVPEASSLLNDILRKMLDPKPGNRPASALEVLNAIDPQAEITDTSPFPLSDWSQRRIRSRQNTILLNTLFTLLNSGEAELANQMIETLSDYLQKDHEGFLRYFQSRGARLCGEDEAAKEWRRQAKVKCYSQRDPKLKTLLLLEEGRVAREAGFKAAALEALDEAWAEVQDYPDPILQVEVLFERGRVQEDLGDDLKALQNFQAASLLIPPQGPHPWTESVNGELAELLIAYGLPRQALPLVEASTPRESESPQTRAERHTQIALCYVGLKKWEEAEGNFREAITLYGSLKKLAEVIWVGAHHVRLHLARRDFPKARRELRALRNRNRGKNYHEEFLDLLELKYWLETGEGVRFSFNEFIKKLRHRAQDALEEGFFRDLGWPPRRTCEIYEKMFHKLGHYSEEEVFAKKAAELQDAMLSELTQLGYEEEAPLVVVPELAKITPMKVESLLGEEEKTHREPDREVMETQASPEIDPLEARIQDLEKMHHQLLLKNEEQTQENLRLKRSLREAQSSPPVDSKIISSVQPMVKPSLEEGVLPELGEKEKIEAVLEKYKGNKSHAAKELGIHRRTLFEKIKKYGLEELSFLPNKEEIEAALQECGGKKSKAAKKLGMSRSSFYRRMKELGI